MTLSLTLYSSHFQVYAAWETDEIIGFELWRNLGLAMICVFVITLILLADFKICFLVLVCVILTLVSDTKLLRITALVLYRLFS